MKAFINHILSNNENFNEIITNYESYAISEELPDDIKDELFKLTFLNRKYPIQKTKQVFDVLGWLNAFLVNSVGVAISGLSIAAFISQILFNYGIISSANIYAPIAYLVLITCFASGAIAASVLTRLRTKSVGEDMSVSFYNWIESKNKLKIFSPKNIVTFLAIIISLTVAIGFAGFNYYTGYYFGSMLVELWFGNPANLVNPAYILDARNSISGLGIAFALIGFTFTILSTSSFLYEVVYNAINNLKNTVNNFFTDLHKDNNWIYKFGGYTLITADIVAIAMVINSAAFTSSQALLITTLALATTCLSLSIVLYINYPKEAQANLNAYIGYGIALTMVFVMAFACAATAAIGTAKVGSFWYTYLPSMLATTPLLQTYGMIVFIAAMIAFPAVFGSAFADIYSKFQEWLNPTKEPAIFNADEYGKPRTTIEMTNLGRVKETYELHQDFGNQVVRHKSTIIKDINGQVDQASAFISDSNSDNNDMIDVPLEENDNNHDTNENEALVPEDISSEQKDDIITQMANRELAIIRY